MTSFDKEDYQIVMKALLYSGDVYYDKDTNPKGLIETDEFFKLKKNKKKLNDYLNDMVNEYYAFVAAEELVKTNLLKRVDEKGNPQDVGYSTSGMTIKQIESIVRKIWKVNNL